MTDNKFQYRLDSKIDKSSIQLNPNCFSILDQNNNKFLKIEDLFEERNNLGLITTTPFNKDKLTDFLGYNSRFIKKIDSFEYFLENNFQLDGKIIEFKNEEKKYLILNEIPDFFKIIGIYKFENNKIGYNLVNN